MGFNSGFKGLICIWGAALGRPKRRWEANIQMDLQDVGWRGGDMDRIALTQYRERWRALVNAVMNIRVPHTAGIFSTS